MSWQEVGLSAGLTIVGSGLGTTFVGMLFKRKFDRELEVQKAFLTRVSRVHDRSVDTLTKLYRYLYEAEAFLQLLSATARYEGERPEEYPRRFVESLVAARDELSAGRLLIPSHLVEQCDRFFNKLFEGQTELGFATHPMVLDGLQRAHSWDKAKSIAYEQVPELRREIEKIARAIIHGNDGLGSGPF
jgi:hypothetical protein